MIKTRLSDIDKSGKRTEWICPHGIGHHRGVHGCDGCCANEPKMKETTEDITTPLESPKDSNVPEWEKGFDSLIDWEYVYELQRVKSAELEVADFMEAYEIKNKLREFIQITIASETAKERNRCARMVEQAQLGDSNIQIDAHLMNLAARIRSNQ